MGDYRVHDPARETFWTRWPQGQGFGKLLLLNTDWTQKANVKNVTVQTPVLEFPAIVREREAQIISYLPFGALVADSSEPHVEFRHVSSHQAHLRIHATGRHEFTLFTLSPELEIFADGKTVSLMKRSGQESTFELAWPHSTVIDLQIRTDS